MDAMLKNDPGGVPIRDQNERWPRMLLVEDNEVNQEVALGILNLFGCRVDVAIDGRHAIEMAKATAYDLVFMDIQMPEIDGFTAARRIRENEMSTHVPIVAVTAHAMGGYRERCMEAGMDDYLSKPVSARAIRAMLNKCLAPKFPAFRDSSTGGASIAPAIPKKTKKPALDLLAALERIGGNVERLRRITSMLEADLPRTLENLRASLATGDSKEAERFAHILKGQGAQFGFEQLRKDAEEAERTFREAPLADGRALLLRLERSVALLCKELDEIDWTLIERTARDL